MAARDDRIDQDRDGAQKQRANQSFLDEQSKRRGIRIEHMQNREHRERTRDAAHRKPADKPPVDVAEVVVRKGCGGLRDRSEK